jgi:hypothetical protein
MRRKISCAANLPRPVGRSHRKVRSVNGDPRGGSDRLDPVDIQHSAHLGYGRRRGAGADFGDEAASAEPVGQRVYGRESGAATACYVGIAGRLERETVSAGDARPAEESRIDQRRAIGAEFREESV